MRLGTTFTIHDTLPVSFIVGYKSSAYESGLESIVWMQMSCWDGQLLTVKY